MVQAANRLAPVYLVLAVAVGGCGFKGGATVASAKEGEKKPAAVAPAPKPQVKEVIRIIERVVPAPGPLQAGQLAAPPPERLIPSGVTIRRELPEPPPEEIPTVNVSPAPGRAAEGEIRAGAVETPTEGELLREAVQLLREVQQQGQQLRVDEAELDRLEGTAAPERPRSVALEGFRPYTPVRPPAPRYVVPYQGPIQLPRGWRVRQ